MNTPDSSRQADSRAPVRPAPRVVVAILASLVSTGCGGASSRVGASAAVDEVKRTIALGLAPNTTLVVDWSGKARRDLELALDRGVVAVAVRGDQVVLLEGCLPGKTYRYRGFDVSKEAARTQNKGRDGADIPFAGAVLGTTAEQGGSASVEVYSVGRFEGPATAPKSRDLPVHCQDATHIIASAEVGAFMLSRGGTDTTTDGIDLAAVSATSTRENNSAATTTSGSPDACVHASRRDSSPPDRCSSVHTIELTPLDDEGVGLRSRAANWTGTYDCASLPWTIRLATTGDGNGALEGDVEVQSGDVSGRWHLVGRYDASARTFSLDPAEPVDVPAGWFPVGYTGTATPSGRRLLGNTSTCGDFVFELISEGESGRPHSRDSDAAPNRESEPEGESDSW